MADFGSATFRAIFDISNLRANAAAARAELGSIGTAASSGLSNVQKGMADMGRTMQSFGRSATTQLTLPIVALGVKAVATAKQVDSAWNEVRKTYNGTQKDIERLIGVNGDFGRAVTDLSIRFGLQRDEVIGVLGRLSAMGKVGPEAIDLLNKSVKFAISGGIELEDGLNAVLGVANTFGLKGDDLQKTLYGLNNVENESAANAFDLSVGLSRAGGAAQVFVGPAFKAKDAVGAIAAGMAVFRERNQETYRSADALRAIFQRLSIVLPGTKDFFAKLGVSVADANGKLKPTPTLLTDIAKNWDKLTQVEQLTFGKKQIGIEFGPLFLQLIDDIRKGVDTNDATVSTFMKQMDLFGNSADGQAKFLTELGVQEDSVEAATGRLSARWGLLVDAMTPIIKEILPPVIDFVGRLLQRITELDPGMQKWIVIIGAVVAALGPVALIVGTVISALAGLLSLPVIAVVGAIAAIAVLVAKNWRTVGPILANVGRDLLTILGPAIGNIIQAFKNLWPLLKVVAIILGVTLLAALYAIAGAIRLASVIVLQITEALKQFGHFLQWVVEVAAAAVAAIIIGFGIMVRAVIDAFNWIQNVISGVFDWLSRNWPLVLAILNRASNRGLAESMSTGLPRPCRP